MDKKLPKTPEIPKKKIDRKIGHKSQPTALTREAVRAKLEAAGALAKDLGIPVDIRLVSDEEIRRAGTLAPGAPTTHEILDEERGPH